MIKTIKNVITILLLLFNLINLVKSTSKRPNPLNSRSISHPSNLNFKIIPNKQSHKLLSNLNNQKRNLNLISKSEQDQLDQLEVEEVERSNKEEEEPNWNDSFLLSFQSHSKSFKLSLRPSLNLIHPNGIKSFETKIDSEGNSIVTETRILRDEIKAYEGWVLRDSDDSDQWIKEEMSNLNRGDGQGRGWVRLILPSIPSSFKQQEEVQFQGSFETDEGYFTIFNTQNYLKTKELLDPEPPLKLRKRSTAVVVEGEEVDDDTVEDWITPSMVIIRERDVLTPQEQVVEMKKRGLSVPSWDEASESSTGSSSTSSCGHDHLEFNTDPNHPVYDPNFNYLQSNSLSETLFSPSQWGKSFSKYPPPPESDSTLTSSSQTKILNKRQGDIGGGTNLSSNFINSIGSTAGCPKSPMVLFMGIAADCTYVNHYTSADIARTQILTDINSASALYSSSFNLSLGIIELNVQSSTCPTSLANVDPKNPWNVGCLEGGSPGLALNDRLSTFSAWRGRKGGDGAGLWHLFTNCSTGSEVGVAWLGQLCKVNSGTSQGQSTSGTGVTAITRSEWQVFAHETGHNLGAIHDCSSGCNLRNSNPVCCPLSTTSCDASANFIMSPVSSKNVSTFSPCSIGNICYSLGNSLNTSCLAVPGTVGNPRIISLKSCGNGILEEGEDCDPGGRADSCCNATTCKFAPGAVCDPLNSLCCSSTCQLARAGTVCRPSVDANCDTPEVCTGQNSTCPADVFASDGKSCGANDLACATGVCTSRSLQCQTAGISLGLTSACPIRSSSSCMVTCADPSSSSDCIVLEQNFRDGSPCGYAGTCSNSVCQSGAPLAVATSWYRQNLQIAIPVTIAVAAIIIIIFVSICRCTLRRSKQRQIAASSKYQQSLQMQPMRIPNQGEPGQGFRSKYMIRSLSNGFSSRRDNVPPPPPLHNRNGETRRDVQFVPPPLPPRASGGGVGSGFRFNRNGSVDPSNTHGGRNWVDPVAYNGPENRG